MFEKCMFCESRKIKKIIGVSHYSIDPILTTIHCKQCGYQRVRRIKFYEFLFL